MSHVEISRSKEPIRLFKSDILEFFTHISPVVVLAIWLPVAIYFLARAIIETQGSSVWHVPVGFVIGLFIWTLAEYTLHRFVFHFRPRSPWQERVTFLFHGVHHAQPLVKTRLVMPPVVSIPLAILFYGLFSLIVGTLLGATTWTAPLFAGFVFGYLFYDMLHYSSHHFSMGGYVKFVKIYHMNHHFKTPDQRFGVSSPLWDMVFGTRPA